LSSIFLYLTAKQEARKFEAHPARENTQRRAIMMMTALGRRSD